jgi:CAAX protease family protein
MRRRSSQVTNTERKPRLAATNDAAAVRIEAQARAGELLREMAKRGASEPPEVRTRVRRGDRSDRVASPRGDRLRCVTVRQLPLPRLVALALVPGAAGTLVYIVLSGPIDAAGLPRIDALLVAIVVAIIPIEVGILLAARVRVRAVDEPLIPYREPMPVRSWLWLVPALVVSAVLASGLLMFVDTAIAGGLFSWLPGWYLRPIDVDLARRYSTAAWTVSLIAYMVLNSLAGPIVEEFYFRGFLLPRMDRFGRWAPLLNATVFSLYHFWSPWQLLSRIAAVAPFVYAVRWRRNVYLGMAVHCSLNIIGGTLVVANIAQRL